MSGEPGLSLAADRPIVVAHRGASVERPENTIDAFETAIEAGADAVEFDVRLTADGEPVVMHDADVSRTSDGEGLVSDLTLEEIRELGVPTLDEALACLAGRAAADIELKNEWYEPGYVEEGAPALERVFDALDRTAFPGPVLLSSFDAATLRRSRQLRPDIPTGLLTSADTDAAAALRAAAGDDHPWVLPFVAQVLHAGAGFVEEVHEAGLRLGTWIADNPEMARTLFSWGVDAVATNDPRAIVSVRNLHGLSVVSARTLPNMLQVVLFADGRPFRDAWVAVHLGTTKKNAHGFLAGPSDDDGRIDVPRQRIEERVQDQLTTSPMDYGGLNAWDGLINVEPLTREAADGVVEAIRVWDGLGSIGTEENLERFRSFRRALESMPGAELTATATCEPLEAATITTSVRRA